PSISSPVRSRYCWIRRLGTCTSPVAARNDSDRRRMNPAPRSVTSRIPRSSGTQSLHRSWWFTLDLFSKWGFDAATIDCHRAGAGDCASTLRPDLSIDGLDDSPDLGRGDGQLPGLQPGPGPDGFHWPQADGFAGYQVGQ